MEKPFQLLIVDDQPRARQSLSALLVIDFPQIIIFQASNGKEAVNQVRINNPDIVIMDVLMPECDGLEATNLLKRFPHVSGSFSIRCTLSIKLQHCPLGPMPLSQKAGHPMHSYPLLLP